MALLESIYTYIGIFSDLFGLDQDDEKHSEKMQGICKFYSNYLIIHTDFVVGRGIRCGIESLFVLCNLCLSSRLIEGAWKVRVLVLCLDYKLVIIIFQEDKSLLLPWMIFTLSFLVFYSACAFMGFGQFIVFFVILLSWLGVSLYW